MFLIQWIQYTDHAGADPELLLEGCVNPLGGECQPNILIIFSENPMELKKIWSVREDMHQGHPLQIRHCQGYTAQANRVFPNEIL